MGNQDRSVAVEADRTSIGAADFLCRAHDDRTVHVTLLDPTARDRLLDRDDDHIADRGGLALGSSQDLDALHPARPRIVGDVEIGLHLDHAEAPPLSAGSTARSAGVSATGTASPPGRPSWRPATASPEPSSTTQCLRFEIGRLSSIWT